MSGDGGDTGDGRGAVPRALHPASSARANAKQTEDFGIKFPFVAAGFVPSASFRARGCGPAWFDCKAPDQRRTEARIGRLSWLAHVQPITQNTIGGVEYCQRSAPGSIGLSQVRSDDAMTASFPVHTERYNHNC